MEKGQKFNRIFTWLALGLRVIQCQVDSGIYGRKVINDTIQFVIVWVLGLYA